MKKQLVSVAAGALVLGVCAVPTLAAETEKNVTVSYDASGIVDPGNPTDPDWSVTIPKSFVFTDASLINNNFDVKLNTIKNGGLDTTKKVPVSVTSKNAFDLLNTAGDAINYTVSYGGTNLAKVNTKQSIGFLENEASKDVLDGKAEIAASELDAPRDGVYEDTLTYTVSEAIAK